MTQTSLCQWPHKKNRQSNPFCHSFFVDGCINSEFIFLGYSWSQQRSLRSSHQPNGLLFCLLSKMGAWVLHKCYPHIKWTIRVRHIMDMVVDVFVTTAQIVAIMSIWTILCGMCFMCLVASKSRCCRPTRASYGMQQVGFEVR